MTKANMITHRPSHRPYIVLANTYLSCSYRRKYKDGLIMKMTNGIKSS